MKDLPNGSSRVVNRNIILVFLVGILHVSFFSGIMAYLVLFGLVAAFLLQIVISGRIVDQLRNNEEQKPRAIVKENWINYFVAFLVLAAPVRLMVQLIKVLPLSADLILNQKKA